MRILLVIGRLKRSGSVLGAIALAKQLRHLGCSVTLVTLAHKDTWDTYLLQELTVTGTRVVSADSHTLLAVFRPAKFTRFLQEQKPDLVCSYNIRPDFLNAVSKGPWVSVSSVRVFLGDAYRIQLGRILGSIAVRIYCVALRRMDGVIAISEAIYKWLLDQKISPQRIFHIPNFLDEKWLKEDLMDLPPTHDEIRVVISGKLMKHKRVDWAIRAVCEVANEYPELHLDIVGDGPMRADLERLVTQLGGDGRVVFHGKIDDLKPLLNNAHIVLQTSLVEGIPRALMEAMARGKTILAADIPGMNELIQERVSGYLFDSNSLPSLIEQMKFVLRGKAFLPSLQVRGYITENFNPRVSGEQTLGAFQSMLFAKEGK